MIYLVRHGKAESGGDDSARRLTDRGRADVERVARRLGKAQVRVDRVEHSGLARAAQTAEILARTVGGEVAAVFDLGASDPVEPVARRLEGDGAGSSMLVGHLPFMERLAAYLLTGDADRECLHFRTATVACLEGDGGSWRLEWLLPPDLA
jgi:phosphohistidine phosphatase